MTTGVAISRNRRCGSRTPPHPPYQSAISQSSGRRQIEDQPGRDVDQGR